MNLRVLARVIVCNPEEKKVLLVRGEGADFWNVPGGGWEYEKEHLPECAKREVFEETGLTVEVKKFLYLQEFQDKKEFTLQGYWLAISTEKLNSEHIDLDPKGKVRKVRWFSKDELKDLRILPATLKERLMTTFWDELKDLDDSKRFWTNVVGVD